MSLTSVNLPTTWYNIPADVTRNTFYVKTYNVTAMTDTTHAVTVPAGNYTATQMTTLLNNTFSNSNGLRFIHAYIDPSTMKTTFRAKTNIDGGAPFYAFASGPNTPSPNFYYEVQFQTILTDADLTDCDTDPMAGVKKILAHDNIGYLLGFRSPSYTANKLASFTDFTSFLGTIVTHYCVLRSECVFNPVVLDYVFLELDDFNKNFVTNTVVSKTQRDYIGKNIMGRIPVYSTNQQRASEIIRPGNDIMFKTRDYFGPVRVEKIAARLVDKHGATINLQGNNFSFVLEVVLQYS